MFVVFERQVQSAGAQVGAVIQARRSRPGEMRGFQHTAHSCLSEMTEEQTTYTFVSPVWHVSRAEAALLKPLASLHVLASGSFQQNSAAARVPGQVFMCAFPNFENLYD